MGFVLVCCAIFSVCSNSNPPFSFSNFLHKKSCNEFHCNRTIVIMYETIVHYIRLLALRPYVSISLPLILLLILYSRRLFYIFLFFCQSFQEIDTKHLEIHEKFGIYIFSHFFILFLEIGHNLYTLFLYTMSCKSFSYI